MANDLCTRRLTRELKAIQKSPLTNPRVYTTPLERNILEWHYVIEGSKDTPYEGGFYWGKLIFPKEYPLKPPSVIMLTPNGRFRIGKRLCLSMSDFHPESWNPMWSVSTIITGLISFMVETAPTLGSIESTESQKKKFAQFSLDFNVREQKFATLFPELVALQKRNMEERIRTMGPASAAKTDEELNKIANGCSEGLFEFQGLLTGLAGFLAVLSIYFAIRFI
jgi:ubiquitin-conjugating enzyme E2 J2